MAHGKGAELFARVAAETASEAMTVDEIAQRVGVWRNSAASCVRALHQHGLAHVQAWRPGKGRATPLWRFGPAVDAAPPGVCWAPTPLLRCRPAALAAVGLLRALVEEPHTREELAEISGLHGNTVMRCITVLRERGACHVGEWDCERRQPRPAYRFGACRDAPRPQPMTGREARRRYRARLKERERFGALHRAFSADNSSVFQLAQRAA